MYNQPMRRVRASWIIVIVAALTVSVVGPLRQQVAMQWRAGLSPLALAERHSPRTPFAATSPTQRQDFLVMTVEWLRLVSEPSVRKVTEPRGPTKPEALWAIYQLSRTPESLSTFQRAADLSDRPAVLAAYADSLVSGLFYVRREADPGDATAVAAEAADNARFHFDVTKPLSQTETSKLLDALGRWERADPSNGLPIAIEAWAQYGLHRDSEARMLWVKAAGYPVVDFHALELSRTARELLEEAGLPEPEAGLLVSASAWRLASALRTGARMASYEGRLAQLTGRPQEAVRLWTATAEVGHKVEESASGWTAFWVGVAIESIGAAPTWAWYSDGYTGLKHGPIYGGRVMLGPQHSFYTQRHK